MSILLFDPTAEYLREVSTQTLTPASPFPANSCASHALARSKMRSFLAQAPLSFTTDTRCNHLDMREREQSKTCEQKCPKMPPLLFTAAACKRSKTRKIIQPKTLPLSTCNELHAAPLAKSKSRKIESSKSRELGRPKTREQWHPKTQPPQTAAAHANSPSVQTNKNAQNQTFGIAQLTTSGIAAVAHVARTVARTAASRKRTQTCKPRLSKHTAAAIVCSCNSQLFKNAQLRMLENAGAITIAQTIESAQARTFGHAQAINIARTTRSKPAPANLTCDTCAVQLLGDVQA